MCDARRPAEPQILLEYPEKSYHVSYRVIDHDVFDNRAIFWHNEFSSGVQATSSHTPWSELIPDWRKRK